MQGPGTGRGAARRARPWWQALARATLVAVVLVRATAAHGHAFSPPPEPFFRLEWRLTAEASESVIAGYVHNHYRDPITAVHIRVEIFDATGQAIGDAFGRVAGDVPSGDRGYFTVQVPAGGAAFGVTVYAFAFAPLRDERERDT